MKQNGHVDNFNIIRLFLATLVLLSHGFEILDGNRDREILTAIFGSLSFGEVAVDGFFAVSGYMITQSYLLSPNPLSFIWKRFLRLYPGFLVAVLFCAYLVGPLAGGNNQYLANFEHVQFLSQIPFLQFTALPPVFIGSHYPVLNGSLWTIQWEFFCYLGVCVLGFARLLDMKFIPPLILAAFVIVSLIGDGKTGSKNLDFALRFGILYLCGVNYYLFSNYFARLKYIPYLCGAGLFIGLFSERYANLIIAAPLTYFLISMGSFQFSFTKYTSNIPDISYGTYLYGWPVLKVLSYNVGISSPWLLFSFSAIVSMFLGWLSWNVIEKRFLTRKIKSIFDNFVVPGQNGQR